MILLLVTLMENAPMLRLQCTRMSDTGQNTFVVQATDNLATNEIREEMAQIRIKLVLVFNHLSGGAEEVNVIYCLTKPHHRQNRITMKTMHMQLMMTCEF